MQTFRQLGVLSRNQFTFRTPIPAAPITFSINRHVSRTSFHERIHLLHRHLSRPSRYQRFLIKFHLPNDVRDHDIDAVFQCN